jgi:two-component system, OmpR family, sensor kinase
MNATDKGTGDTQALLLATLEGLLAIEAVDVQGALAQASQQVAAVLRADKVDVFLLDTAHATLVAVGVSDTPMGQRQRALGLDRLPLANGGRAVAVFETGQAHLDGQAERDEQELIGIRYGLGVRSNLAVPLRVQGERRGVLQVSCAQPGRFGEEDSTFLTAVANWIGLLIHRAELVEQSTRAATQAARHAVADELIATLAHDLQNYLTPLKGRLQLLHTRVAHSGQSNTLRDVETVGHLVARMQQLIGDLLDSSRLDHGLFVPILAAIDLVALARDTIAPLTDERFKVVLDLPTEPVLVAGDASRLQQVLENLLSNARKHAQSDTPVQVSLHTEQRSEVVWAVLRVHDNGPGIPSAILPKLMQRFVAEGPGRGLGLGLYLAHGIVEAHGGTLLVASQPGAGTTFEVALPQVGADAITE